MISKDKTYRTRDCREVRIYATDGRGDYPVHGAIKTATGWDAHIWFKNGKSIFDDEIERSADLIEVKPRICRPYWINIYQPVCGSETAYFSKSQADGNASPGRLACVKVEIDCEEGEGL